MLKEKKKKQQATYPKGDLQYSSRNTGTNRVDKGQTRNLNTT
jgi:hypothetical protein